MTVRRGELTVVEGHELLVPHDAAVHSVRVAVDRGRGGSFVARRQLADVGAIVNRPVGCRLTGGTSEVKPRLAVGTGSVVRHASVGRRHVPTWVVGVVSVSRGHAILRRAHVRTTLRAVDFGEGVDVLQLRSAQVSVVASAATSTFSETTSSPTVFTAVSTATASTAIGERRVFTGQLRLDSLAIRRVSDRRQDGSDALDELRLVSMIRRKNMSTVDPQSFAGPCRSNPGWSGSHSCRSCREGASRVGIGSGLRQQGSFGFRDPPRGYTFQQHWMRT